MDWELLAYCHVPWEGTEVHGGALYTNPMWAKSLLVAGDEVPCFLAS